MLTEGLRRIPLSGEQGVNYTVMRFGWGAHLLIMTHTSFIQPVRFCPVSALQHGFSFIFSFRLTSTQELEEFYLLLFTMCCFLLIRATRRTAGKTPWTGCQSNTQEHVNHVEIIGFELRAFPLSLVTVGNSIQTAE